MKQPIFTHKQLYALWALLFIFVIGSWCFLQGEQKKTPLENYQVARKNYESNANEENTIWFGRRAAYLGNYDEAIAIYTRGIEKFPDSYKLYRHRGHRYISTRKFQQAITDFKKAAELVKGQPLEIEPDGNPNPSGIPVSNTQSNIWYHLGLAYYLQADYRNAVSAYKECMKWANNDDLIVCTVDWLYMTYRRMGKKEDALKLLDIIKEKMNLLENHAYHKRLLMYKGLLKPESLLNPGKEASEYDRKLNFVTQGYGVGNWYYYNGSKKKAIEVYEKVIRADFPSAFGYIAAEVDLKNIKEKSQK